jgi:hypothetical protein
VLPLRTNNANLILLASSHLADESSLNPLARLGPVVSLALTGEGTLISRIRLPPESRATPRAEFVATKAIAGTRLSQSYVYLYLSDNPKKEALPGETDDGLGKPAPHFVAVKLLDASGPLLA